MKKLLALVLALVMTLGLATVGTNAATELKDTASVGDDYQEAVTVVNAVEVMIGDENGNFNPSNKLTRAEGAAIAARLIATNKVAAELIGNGTKFTDVPANFWNGNGSGMIEYCAVNGILNGVGDNKFDPNGALSAVAFAKMMLTALGYDSQVEGYVNNVDWATHVMTRANRTGILKGLETVKPTDQLTREQAAQIVFNTLKTPIVEYDQKLYTSNGDVLVGSTNAKPVTNEEKGKQTIFATRVNAQQNANGAYVVEFAEQYYPALVLTNSEDDFGRPANVWTYARNELGKWANKDLFVTSWSEEIKGSKVYDAIGALAYTIRNLNYDREIYVDGVLTEYAYWNGNGWNTSKTTDDIDNITKDGTWLDCSGEGTLLELYVDDDNEYARLVAVNTYFAQAMTDYVASSKSINLGVYEKDYDVQISRTAKLSDDNNIADLKSGDYVLVTMINPRTTDYEIKSVELAKKDSDMTLKAYKSTSKGATTDHMTAIQFADASEFVGVSKYALYKQEILKDYSQEKMKNFSYDVYYDNFGNVIGIDYFKQDTNFVFVVGVESKSSYLAYTTYNANMIFLDGTMKTATVTVNKNGSAATKLKGNDSPVVNAWFTYSTDDAGNMILNDRVLTMAEATAAKVADKTTVFQAAQVVAPINNANEIDASHTTLQAADTATQFAYGNDKSVYITVGVDSTGNYGSGAKKGVGAINEVKGISVGIKGTAIEVADLTKAPTLSNFDGSVFTPSLGVANANTYFLYSSKGYVAAAVVIGEDAGATRNFVYVISGPTQRDYTNAYIDTYKVIKDGKIDTIQVNSQKSGTTELTAKLASFKMHKVVYDKDGIVIDVKDAPNAPGTGLAQTTLTSVNTDANKKAGYTYNEITGGNGSVSLVANTLKIAGTAGNTHYVLIGEDATFFVWNPATSSFDQLGNAQGALDLAKSKDGTKQRYLNSIASFIDGNTGFAKVVVFYDKYTVGTPVAAPSTVTLVGNWTVGAYSGVQFYVEDGHDITYAEAWSKLYNQMLNDNCKDIEITASAPVTLKYTLNGVPHVDTITDLNAGVCNQVYKFTYINAGDATKNAEAYVHESDNMLAAPVGNALVAKNALATEFAAGTTTSGVITSVSMKTYDGQVVSTGAWTGAQPTWAADKADITYVYSSVDVTTALNKLIATAKKVQIVGGKTTNASTFTLNNGVVLTVPADCELVLDATSAMVSVTNNANVVVAGKLTGKDANSKGNDLNVTGNVNVTGTVDGKFRILATGTITLSDDAKVKCTEIKANKVVVGCTLEVDILRTDSIYLTGDGDKSIVKVNTTLTDYSGAVAAIPVDIGTDGTTPTTAANYKGAELDLPATGATLGTVAFAANATTATIVNATAIADVTGKDVVLTTDIDDAGKAKGITTTVADISTTGDSKLVADPAETFVTNVSSTDASGSVTLPAGTAAKSDGTATATSGNSAKVTGTAKTKVSIALSGTTGSVGNESGTTAYIDAGDTITITFKSAVKGTPVVNSTAIKSAELTDDTTLVLTVNKKIEVADTVTVSGLTLKTVADTQEEVTKTIEIKLPALRPDTNTVAIALK